MKGPLVSIYITTHNRGRILSRALDSVIMQTYDNIEIIVSDDGSSDDTPERMKEYLEQYSFIKYIRESSPKGANHARNKAISAANGVFITGLDDDDVFLQDRIKLFVDNWNEKYSFISDNILTSSGNGSSAVPLFSYNTPRVLNYKSLLTSNVVGNQIFTLTERLKGSNSFNERLRKFQDWDCWLRLAHKYGEFKQYNWKTYKVYDEAGRRVSNNDTRENAFKILVESNLNIYDPSSQRLIEKFTFKNEGSKGIRIVDFFNSELSNKYIISMFIKYFFCKS